MAERAPTLQEVVRRGVEAKARGIRTWAPGKITKWDADKQRASVQLLVKEAGPDEEGARVAKSLPVIPGVPVQFLGSSDFRITFPISDGNLIINGEQKKATTGTLFFSHLSLDKWLSGDGKEVDPEFDHSHAITDAVFVPGLMPFGAPWGDVPTDYMSVGEDGGLQIQLKADAVIIGDAAGAQKTLLAETLIQHLSSFVTTLYTVLQAGTAGGPTAQQLTQAAQIATTQLYQKLVAGGTDYLSTDVKNS